MNRTNSTGEAVRRLTAFGADGHPVLSVYVSLDPTDYPHLRDRHMEVDALLADAERRFAGEQEDSRGVRIALREDVARARDFFTDVELAAPAARGLAVFCSTPAELFEVVSLGRPVPPTAVVADRPFVEPLVELGAGEIWCVAMISRRTSRILRGTRTRLTELPGIADEVHRRHSAGGWSQANYQRSIERDVDAHITATCKRLGELQRRPGFDRLLIASPSELRRRVENELPPQLAQHLAGHYEIDVERATAAQALERAGPAIDADEARREREALARLREGLAPGGHAAVGPQDVLEALNEGRVDTLLLAHDASAPGYECPECRRLALTNAACPIDGATPVARENVVERALEQALDSELGVLVIRHEARALAEHGSVAALLRY